MSHHLKNHLKMRAWIVMKCLKMRRMGANGQEKAKAFSDKLAKLKKENAEADERYVKLYDDLSNGIITETKFKMLSGRIEEKQAKANAEIERLEKQILFKGNNLNGSYSTK